MTTLDQLFDDSDEFINPQQLAEDVDAFLTRYIEGAHVLGNPVQRARDDLDSEARLYSELLEQVRKSEFRQQDARTSSDGSTRSTRTMDENALSEIQRSREYVRRMRDQTAEFKRTAQARKRLDELRLRIAKNEQAIDRLMQTSGDFDTRAKATKDIQALSAAVQDDREALVSLIDDLEDDDSFEALIASLREVNYHPDHDEKTTSRFWVVCRLDQHHKLETILFACQATSNAPPSSGWVYLGITMRDTAPVQYKRTDHAVNSEPIEVTEEGFRVAHSDNLTATFVHHAIGSKSAQLQMHISGCSLFSVNGRYVPIYLPFSNGIVYRNPHGWYVMTSHVSTLEASGVRPPLSETEEEDCSVDVQSCDFKAIGRRGTLLMGRDAIERVLYRKDRKRNALDLAYSPVAYQLTETSSTMLEAVQEQEEQEEQEGAQLEHISVLSPKFDASSVATSLEGQADVRRTLELANATDVEWQNPLDDNSKESRAGVQVAQRIIEREQCLQEVQRLAQELEHEFLRSSTATTDLSLQISDNEGLGRLMRVLDDFRNTTVAVVEAIAHWTEEKALAKLDVTRGQSVMKEHTGPLQPISVVIGVRGQRLYDASPAFRSSNRSVQRGFEPPAFGVSYQYIGVYHDRASAERAFYAAIAANRKHALPATADARYGWRACQKHFLLRSANVPPDLPCEQCNQGVSSDTASEPASNLKTAIHKWPFMWNGVNYLSKVASDYKFLATLQVLPELLRDVCVFEDNPLLLLLKPSQSVNITTTPTSPDVSPTRNTAATAEAPRDEAGPKLHKTATFQDVILHGTVCDTRSEADAAMSLKRIMHALHVLDIHALSSQNAQTPSSAEAVHAPRTSLTPKEQLVLARYSNTGAVLTVPQRRPAPAFRQPSMFARTDVGEFASFQTLGRSVREYMRTQQLKKDIMAKTMVRKSLAAELRQQLQRPMWEFDASRIADLLDRTSRHCNAGQLESLIRKAKVALDWHAWFVYAAGIVQRVWRGYICRFDLWKKKRSAQLQLIGKELLENAIAAVARRFVRQSCRAAIVTATRKISHPVYCKAVDVGGVRMVAQVCSMFHHDVMEALAQPKAELCPGCRGKQVWTFSAKHHKEVLVTLPCTCKSNLGVERWQIRLYSGRDSQVMEQAICCFQVQKILRQRLSSYRCDRIDEKPQAAMQDVIAAVTLSEPLPADALRPDKQASVGGRLVWEPLADLRLANSKQEESNIRHACMVNTLTTKQHQLQEQELLLKRLMQAAEVAHFEMEDARSAVWRLDVLYQHSKQAIGKLLLASQPITIEGSNIAIQRRPWNRLESAAQRKWLKVKGRCEDDFPAAYERLAQSFSKVTRVQMRIRDTLASIKSLKRSSRRLALVAKRYGAIVASVSRTATRVRAMVQQAMSMVLADIVVTNAVGVLTTPRIVFLSFHHDGVHRRRVLWRAGMLLRSAVHVPEQLPFQKRYLASVLLELGTRSTKCVELKVQLHRLGAANGGRIDDTVVIAFTVDDILRVLGGAFETVAQQAGLGNCSHRTGLHRLLISADPRLLSAQQRLSQHILSTVKLHPFSGQPYVSFMARQAFTMALNPLLRGRPRWKMLLLRLISPTSIVWSGKRWFRAAPAVWSIRCALGSMQIDVTVGEDRKHYRRAFSFLEIVRACSHHHNLLVAYMHCVLVQSFPEELLFGVLQHLRLQLPGLSWRRELRCEQPSIYLTHEDSTSLLDSEMLRHVFRVVDGHVAVIKVYQLPFGTLRFIVAPPARLDDWVIPAYRGRELALDVWMDDLQALLVQLAQQSNVLSDTAGTSLHVLVDWILDRLTLQFPQHLPHNEPPLEKTEHGLAGSCSATMQRSMSEIAERLYQLHIISSDDHTVLLQQLPQDRETQDSPTLALRGCGLGLQPLTSLPLYEGHALLAGGEQQWIMLHYSPGSHVVYLAPMGHKPSEKAVRSSNQEAMQMEDVHVLEQRALLTVGVVRQCQDHLHLQRLRQLATVNQGIADALSKLWSELQLQAATMLRTLYQHIHLGTARDEGVDLLFELTDEEIGLLSLKTNRSRTYSTLPFVTHEQRNTIVLHKCETALRRPRPITPSVCKQVSPPRKFRDMCTWRYRDALLPARSGTQAPDEAQNGESGHSPLTPTKLATFGPCHGEWKLLARDEDTVFVKISFDVWRHEATVQSYDVRRGVSQLSQAQLSSHATSGPSDHAVQSVTKVSPAPNAVFSAIAATLVEEYIRAAGTLVTRFPHELLTRPQTPQQHHVSVERTAESCSTPTVIDQKRPTHPVQHAITVKIPSDLNQPIELLRSPGTYWLEELPGLLSPSGRVEIKRQLHLPAICYYAVDGQRAQQHNERANAWLEDWYENHGWRAGRAFLKIRQQLKQSRYTDAQAAKMIGDVIVLFRTGQEDYRLLLEWEERRVIAEAAERRSRARTLMTHAYQCKANFLEFAAEVQAYARVLCDELAQFHEYGAEGPPEDAAEFCTVAKLKAVLRNLTVSSPGHYNRSCFSVFDTDSRIALRTFRLQQRFESPVTFKLFEFNNISGETTFGTPANDLGWPAWDAQACAWVVLYEVYVAHCLSCTTPFADCKVPECGDIRGSMRGFQEIYSGISAQEDFVRSALQSYFVRHFNLQQDGQLPELSSQSRPSPSKPASSGGIVQPKPWRATMAEIDTQVQRLRRLRLTRLGLRPSHFDDASSDEAFDSEIQSQNGSAVDMATSRQLHLTIALPPLRGLLSSRWTINEILLQQSVQQLVQVIIPRIKYHTTLPGGGCFNRVLGARTLKVDASLLRFTMLYGIFQGTAVGSMGNYCKLCQLEELQAGLTVVAFDCSRCSACSLALSLSQLEYIWRESGLAIAPLDHEFVFAAECLGALVQHLLRQAPEWFAYHAPNVQRSASLHLRLASHSALHNTLGPNDVRPQGAAGGAAASRRAARLVATQQLMKR